MGNGCYRNLTNLQKVTLPASFTTLGHSCFENCPVFTTYEVAGGSTTFAHNSNGWLLSKDGKTLVSFPSGIAGDVEIPEGITTLATTAFKVCRKVGKVTIPASLITIDQTTNASLYAVGNYFEVNANNPAFQDIDGVLCSKDGKTLIAFPPHYDKTKLGTDGKYTIPTSVEKIGSEAFCQTEDFLKTVDLNNTKQLANEAFLWTNGLETVNIGKYVSKIENGAFLNCPVLAQFTVDTDNTTYSGKDGMIYSKDATKLILCPTGKTGEYVIPEGTISVEDKAFYGSKLSKITFPSTLKSVGSEGFRFSTISQLDFGTDSHLETIYGTAFAGTQLAGTITIPASVSRIDGRIFHGTNVSSIHIADGSQLTEIKQQGFDELAELESFVFDGTNSVTKIGVEAFANCPKLKSFEIPADVTNIYNGAFLNTPLLETIIFKEPAAITVIGKGAFGGSGIKNISLPESVTTIEEQAFDNCKNLTTIDIPKNVSDIQTGAFNFCEALTAINVDASNNDYASLDGMLCTKDKKTLVTFPAGKADSRYTLIPNFMTVGQYAFYSSNKVTNVTFPKTVTEIKTRALALCKNLKSLSFMGEDNVPTLNADITYESTANKDITIFVRKRWYENHANDAAVDTYNTTFKEVHPSFVTEEGYDRGTEFFPTSVDNVGVISFYTPRTSVIISKTAQEPDYTDARNKHWPAKTYTVSSVLDYAYQNETTVKDIVILSDIDGHLPADFYYRIGEKDLNTYGDANVMKPVTVNSKDLMATTEDGHTNLYLSSNKVYKVAQSAQFKSEGKLTLGVHKAYMNIDLPLGAKAMLVFDDNSELTDETTDIADIEQITTGKDGVYYNLQGQKVSKSAQGIYIHNGKKVIVK